MVWFHYASSFLAISQLLFMSLLYLVYYRRQLIGRLLAAFGLCLIAYIITRLPGVRPGLLEYPLFLAATLVPALLWLIARFLFVDKTRVHPGMWLLIAGYVTVRAIGLWFYDGTQSSDSLFFRVYFYLPQLIMLFLAAHVVFMGWRGLGSDLVEPRRRLRVPFSIGMAIIVGAILFSGFFMVSSTVLDSIYFSFIFLLTLLLNLVIFQIHKDVPQLIVTAGEVDRAVGAGEADSASEDPIVDAVDKELIERIRQAMYDEKLYKQTGLTIGALASHLSIQEYRLRRIINRTLHYRNFNQYLNSYRIAEAARLLRDPEEARHSISTIALEVGYASLSSFNKAFKEIRGVTPTEYRKPQ